MELQIKKFNVSLFEQKRKQGSSPITIIIGKRNTGKSQIIKAIMHANRDIPSGIAISPTETSNSFYSTFCPKLFVHTAYNPQIIENIIKKQKEKIKKYGKRPENDFFLILDDCMFESKKIGRDVGIREIFLNGRHYQIFLILSLQYVMDLPVVLRSNADYVFCLRENNLQNVEKLYKCFFGIFPSKGMFNQAFAGITENYGSIVLDNTSRSNKINSCVYWFRAPYPSKDFRIGNKKFWKLHNKYYNEDSDQDEDEQNDDLILSPQAKLKTILTK